MKKLNLSIAGCIVLLSLFNLKGTCQTTFDNSLMIGPKAGVTLNDLPALNGSAVPGISFGGSVTKNVTNHVGITGDLMFSTKGAHWTERSNVPGFYQEWTNTTTLRYIEAIPQVILYLNHDTSRFRPKFIAGPSVSLLADVRESTAYRFTDYNRDIQGNATTVRDPDERYKKVDIGAVVGVGANTRVGKRSILTLDLRYNAGFSRVFRYNGDGKNRGWGAYVGLMVPFGSSTN